MTPKLHEHFSQGPSAAIKDLYLKVFTNITTTNTKKNYIQELSTWSSSLCNTDILKGHHTHVNYAGYKYGHGR